MRQATKTIAKIKKKGYDPVTILRSIDGELKPVCVHIKNYFGTVVVVANSFTAAYKQLKNL